MAHPHSARPLPTCQNRRSRVIGLRARRIRRSASRQNPFRSLQGVPGAASLRGTLPLLLPPPGQWARPATSHTLALMGTTDGVVLGKKTAKHTPLNCRNDSVYRREEAKQTVLRQFLGFRFATPGRGCLTWYACRAVAICTGKRRRSSSPARFFQTSQQP